MVHVITSHDRDYFSGLLAHMHQDRRRVFVERLGWDLPAPEGEEEYDQFDTDEAIYLIAADRQGRHQASVRLLPTTGPHLLSTVFPHLCARGVPRGEDTWELTRMCVSPEAEDQKSVRQMIRVATVEFALLWGVRRYTAVSYMGLLSQVLAVGWDCEPLGMPAPDANGDMVGALRINITPDTLSLVRARAGLRAPVLRWETRHAA